MLCLCFTAMFDQRIIVGSEIIVPCTNKGNVSWSKRVNGSRQLILRAQTGENLNPALHHRYNITTNLSLVIREVSESDSGVYYCNSVPVVDLTVMPLKGGCVILSTFFLIGLDVLPKLH